MYMTPAEVRMSPKSELPRSSRLEADIHKALTDQPDAIQALTELLRQLAGRGQWPYPVRALRTKEVLHMTGDGRSHFYDRLNEKSPSYQSSFPRPFYVDAGRSPRWWQHEVLGWLETQAAATSRKRGKVL
jgi:prophage regulatory protein